jgi:hypothetical protein
VVLEVSFGLDFFEKNLLDSPNLSPLSFSKSPRFGMAEPIMDQVERLTGKRTIAFRWYVTNYNDARM